MFDCGLFLGLSFQSTVDNWRVDRVGSLIYRVSSSWW